jgi:transposase-like protein
MGIVYEAYTNGVSTRKMNNLIKSLGIDGISSSQVSEICKNLDDQVSEFRNRALEQEYPVLLCDALYEKVRKNGRVVSMAILVVIGVNIRGSREILAVEPMLNESEESYTAVFNSLKDRGLKKTWLIVSDAHQGIQAAVRKGFLGASWQRCKVHFMRNIMARVTQKEKNQFADKLKRIWLEPDKDAARKRAVELGEEYRKKFPEAIDTLMEGLEDSLTFYDFPRIDPRKISSTNMLERLNREIRRRSRVVGVFPSEESYVRLVGSYILEYADDWTTSRSYIREESILEQRTLLDSAA